MLDMGRKGIPFLAYCPYPAGTSYSQDEDTGLNGQFLDQEVLA